ncbi:MAG: 50S ribosomal protein L4 [Candidatus Kerfeldbacteria bacterium]
MAKVKLYNLDGKASGEIELDDAVFGVEVNPELVQFVVSAQQANAHIPYAHTKQRAEKRGGGRKPWRQKGTGRARHGSSRSPIWRGGGVTFGPTNDRNMTKKVNKKEKRKALSMVLSDKVSGNMFIVIDSIEQLEGKTKQLATVLSALPSKGKSVLIASGKKNAKLTRAANNLPNANTVLADSLSVGDVLKYNYVLIDKDGVETVTSALK